MFKLSDINFMENNLKIDVTSIDSKLKESSIVEFSQIIKDAVEKFIEAIRNFEVSGKQREIYTFEDNVAEKAINSYANMLSEKIENNDALQVLAR